MLGAARVIVFMFDNVFEKDAPPQTMRFMRPAAKLTRLIAGSLLKDDA